MSEMLEKRYAELGKIAFEAIRAALERATPEERATIFEAVFGDYCTHCFDPHGDSICQCTNDE